MAKPESDENTRLRVTSDSLLADLEVLQSLESEKREIAPDSERFRELARQIEELATHIQASAVEQRERGQEIHEGAAGEPGQPIAETPPRPITEILAEWRDAERRAADAERGSLEEALARSDAQRLRSEYQRAHRVASADQSGGSIA